uniref:Reverse transcriptase domain-containing protein n=1 Tax=Aegilops tauschii subsp. strangulata TaxID=200361 RepID=A0A453E7K8_AEGTS
MECMATSYFQEVFTKDPTLTPTGVLDGIAPKVTQGMNDMLCAPFSEEEVSNALFQIGPIKAPGTDGLPARFFQRNRAVLKIEIIAAVLDLFKSGVMPEGVNDTTIVLIPKVPHPKELKDFRPVSLCNVLYKIVSKCLVNRLRPLLGELISENQSAFIPGRLISDNSIIAFECIHHIQTMKTNSPAACAYKLDLSEAYDRVDWEFLEQALIKWGFSREWISWIMACVKSVKYSIKFNGKLLESFTPSRGLRQGDPLSPFLFLFIADALSSLLSKSVNEGELKGVSICRGAPVISHLPFADDTMLLFEATSHQATIVKGLLNTYSRATGQLINPEKCSILFSDNCVESVAVEMKGILEVTQQVFEPKYLGLPVLEGRAHKGQFETVQDRLRKRLVDWGEQYVSSDNKEILIKAVAQALPTYVMSVFRLPASVCDDLTRMMR